MRKKRRLLLAALLMMFGLGVLLYPAVSSAVNSYHGSYAIQEFQDQVGNTDEALLTEAEAQAKAYNAALLHHETPENYEQILNFANGMMGYVQIPKINVHLPIYHGVSEEVLAKGIGHMPQSAFPIGGEGNHAVLTGHTGLPSAKLFTDLTELQEEDMFYVNILEQTLAYRVDQIRVVLPSEGQELAPVAGKDYCTLVTCTPYGVNSHRLLVRGQRMEMPREDALQQITMEMNRRESRLWIPAVLLGLLIPVGAVFILRKRS